MTGASEIIHHYDAARAKRGLLSHGLAMFRYPWRAWESRGLVWNFFVRELLGRFRGSLGGIFWVLVQPIFQFAVFFFVFGILFGPRVGSGGADPFFAVYLFAGIVLFNSLQEGSSRALTSIVMSGNLVRKVVFPCELLPLTPIFVSSVVYMMASVVLLLVGSIAGVVSIGWEILAWPVLVVLLTVFSLGLGLFLAAAQVFARDVSHLWGVLSLAWFFMSPIFWSVQLIEDAATKFGVEGATQFLLLNPAFCLLMAQRQVFGIGSTLPAEDYARWFPYSLGENLLVCAGWAVVTFYVGFGFFMSRKHKFADLV